MTRTIVAPNIHPGNIDAKVEVTELMGNEVFLYLLTGGHSYVARVDPRSKAQGGQRGAHGGEPGQRALLREGHARQSRPALNQRLIFKRPSTREGLLCLHQQPHPGRKQHAPRRTLAEDRIIWRGLRKIDGRPAAISARRCGSIAPRPTAGRFTRSSCTSPTVKPTATRAAAASSPNRDRR